MKILNLVIHTSKYPEYERMYEILSPYYSKEKEWVDTLFVEYKENLNCDHVFSEDRLFLKGSESKVPGLLQKTLDALLILSGRIDTYDYVIRSNVSTVIIFSRLKAFIESNKQKDYFGGKVFYLTWLDPSSGITDEKYLGTYFAQGTLIGFSRQLCKFIVERRHQLNFGIVDDVSIGLFLRDHWQNGTVHYVPKNQFIEIKNMAVDVDEIFNINVKFSPIAWRNKSLNRDVDIQNIKNIVGILTR